MCIFKLVFVSRYLFSELSGLIYLFLCSRRNESGPDRTVDRSTYIALLCGLSVQLYTSWLHNMYNLPFFYYEILCLDRLLLFSTHFYPFHEIVPPSGDFIAANYPVF